MHLKPSATYWTDKLVSDSPSDTSSSTRRGHAATRLLTSESSRVNLQPLRFSRCRPAGKCLHKRTTPSRSTFSHATLSSPSTASELSSVTRPSTVTFWHRARFSASSLGLRLKWANVSSLSSRDSRLSLRRAFVWASSLFSELVSMIQFVRSRHSIRSGLKRVI